MSSPTTTRTQTACPVCGGRLYARSRENEECSYTLSETGFLHHSCLLMLEEVMAEHDLRHNRSGVEAALGLLRGE